MILEPIKFCKLTVRVGTLNVGTVTGKDKELADLTDRRKVGVFEN